MHIAIERVIPSSNLTFGAYEHLHRYALATNLCKDKIVLDIACGEGYGTNILSNYAKKIYGVDISYEAVDHARIKYKKPNIDFRYGSATNIPLPANSVETVVCFETIEHLNEHFEMLSEIKRVMVKDGILIVSSPEKSIYSQRDPNNKYHIKELHLFELESLIKKFFKHNYLLKQQIVIGSLICPVNSNSYGFQLYDGNFDKIENKLLPQELFNKPFFNILICSDNEITINTFPGASFFSAFTAYITEKENYVKFNEKIKKFAIYRIYKYISRIFR
jgi:ubiquinone/menaquinone biosynthesis C-methylase UbiE